MKNSKYTKYVAIALLILFLVTSLISCSSTHYHTTKSGKIPPGQAKKINGSKSAKAYAPGQQKKK